MEIFTFAGWLPVLLGGGFLLPLFIVWFMPVRGPFAPKFFSKHFS